MSNNSTWRHSDVISLKEAMKEALKEMHLDGAIQSRRYDKLWRQMTGPVIAASTQKVEFYKKKLVVTLDNAPLRYELTMGKDKILQQLNMQLLEEDKINELILR